MSCLPLMLLSRLMLPQDKSMRSSIRKAHAMSWCFMKQTNLSFPNIGIGTNLISGNEHSQLGNDADSCSQL